MPVNPMDKYRDLILQAEIAALLHDIGKLTEGFITSEEKRHKHSSVFLKEVDVASPAPCIKDLLNILNSNLKGHWSEKGSQVSHLPTLGGIPGQTHNLKTLGDLLRYHHSSSAKQLGWSYNKHTPLLIALMMISDTIDSASSKGGAHFSAEGRRAILNQADHYQDLDGLFFSSPLGQEACKIPLVGISDQAEKFQTRLAQSLENFGEWSLEQLISNRSELMDLFKKDLNQAMADTRIPTNDVSLWHHSYYTASIFKALLARHLILGISKADKLVPKDKIPDSDKKAKEEMTLQHHEEKLAFLGIRWNYNDLLSNAVRPKDIIGRIDHLRQLADSIRPLVETEFCLGNQIYRDREGVVFLIPSPDEKKDDEESVKNIIDKLADRIEGVVNDPQFFRGDITYRII